MYDLVSVHIITGTDELNEKEASLGFCEAASATKHIHEGTAWAKLTRHVHVVLVLETILEADDIGMLERAVYLYFGVELGFFTTQLTL